MKGGYTQPKAYRPIALLSTLGKALESIMAARISFAAEEFDLLSKTYGRTQGTRNRARTSSAIGANSRGLFEGEGSLRAANGCNGVFDNLSHIRLIHNLKKRRIAGNLMN